MHTLRILILSTILFFIACDKDDTSAGDSEDCAFLWNMADTAYYNGYMRYSCTGTPQIITEVRGRTAIKVQGDSSLYIKFSGIKDSMPHERSLVANAECEIKEFVYYQLTLLTDSIIYGGSINQDVFVMYISDPRCNEGSIEVWGLKEQ